jgi:hypothetical protein
MREKVKIKAKEMATFAHDLLPNGYMHTSAA